MYEKSPVGKAKDFLCTENQLFACLNIFLKKIFLVLKSSESLLRLLFTKLKSEFVWHDKSCGS